MARLTSEACKQHIVELLRPMMQLPEYPERQESLPFDEGDYFDDYPENRAWALVPKHWKRLGKTTTLDEHDLELDSMTTDRLHGHMTTRPITRRWFSCFGVGDGPDPRLHARVYEQDGQTFHTWLFSEG